MIPRFADSFYYIALMNSEDRAHRPVAAFSAKAHGRVVTTTWVLVEVADAFATPRLRPLFLDLIQLIRSDPETEILSDSALFDRGLDLYARRPDKAWSLTDCISFVVMEDRGLVEALTGDRHFEQAGFRALLRADA